MKEPVTTEAAAQMLDVSRWAVLKAIRDGRLTAERFGRDWMIDSDEVERYRRERKLTGPRKHRPGGSSAMAYPERGDHATGRLLHAAERQAPYSI